MLEGLSSDILDRPLSLASDDTDGDALAHFGIKGQKWGVRRYQNSDGSLTEEGKLRYGDSRQSRSRRHLTKGQVRFAQDALASLNQTPLSKDEKAFNETIKELGKAAEESGAMDPNHSLSPYDLSRSPEQSELFNAIYENMPSVKKNTDILYKQEASEYKKNADGFKEEKTTHLDDVINEFHPDLHKELGTNPGKETRNYLIDAVKGFNEGDPDMVTYQHMDLAPELFDKGYLDKQTFNKLYDAQAAEDAVDNLQYGWDSDDIKQYNGWYKELHHSDDTSDFLAHHGVKGQKWGNRRYQNSDGSLTPLGRVRYGVGAARKVVGKAAGKALRKATGRQTDAELQEELNKAIKKHNRDVMKRDIDNLSGKRKKISKMTDSELDAYIDRMAREQQARSMSKELKNEGRNFISKFAHEAAENAARQAVAGIGEGVKRGISNSLATKFDEAEKRKQAKKWDEYDEKHNADKVDAAKSRDKLNAARDKLELRALNGDVDAAAVLNRVAKSSKGNADKHSNTSATKDAVENARNILELQAINGDKEALKRLKKITDAKKGSKNNGKGGGGKGGSGDQGSDGKKNSNNSADKPNNQNGKKQDTSQSPSNTSDKKSKKNSQKSTDNSESKKSTINSQEAYQAARQKAKENLKRQASTPVSEARTYSVSNDTIDWMAELSSRKALPPAKS